jgi:putative redox protein
MLELTARYAGNKKCDLRHPDGAEIRTDAPRDIGGDASAFSPTDLVAAGLVSCILTTLAMVAERLGVDVTGATARVEKHMSQSPRRIGRLPVVVTLAGSIAPEHRERLERAGRACPVHASLHPEIDAPIEFRYA